MSAVNVLVQSQQVHVMSDGLCYDRDGNKLSLGSKVSALPHLNAAFALRGPAVARPLIAELVGNCASSFDELSDRIVDLLQDAASIYAPAFNQCSGDPEFEVVIAGISEVGGPTAYLVASHGSYGEPWTKIALDGFMPMPNIEAINAAVQTLLPDNPTADALDPATFGVAAMEVQRNYLLANQGMIGGRLCAIGGFVQLTTVSLDGIETRILHRWTD